MKAFIFPGQGAQYPGMGRELREKYPIAQELMALSDDILGFGISKVMEDGSEEDLRATKVTQPAVYIHSYIEFAALCGLRPDSVSGGILGNVDSASDSVRPDMTAGHSLGEFTALAAAGAISFADGLRLVSLRARAMQRCCEARPGAMAAVINLPASTIEEICRDINDSAGLGVLVAANYNSDAQTVISGTSEAVALACTRMKEAGARRALPLQVGGAFHSPLMEPARLELAQAVQETRICRPSCPVYQNVTALPSSDPDEIRRNLVLQLTRPVRWAQSVRNMVADGASEFVECGPGTVLEGLVRKSVADASSLSIHHAGA